MAVWESHSLNGLGISSGAPLPFAPPCIRQRPLGIAGAWHGVPRLVFAPQRGLRCIGSFCIGLSFKFFIVPTTLDVSGDDRLPSVLYLDVLDNDGLPPTCPQFLQGPQAVLICPHQSRRRVCKPGRFNVGVISMIVTDIPHLAFNLGQHPHGGGVKPGQLVCKCLFRAVLCTDGFAICAAKERQLASPASSNRLKLDPTVTSSGSSTVSTIPG